MREKVPFGSLRKGDKFHTGPRAKATYVKLPDSTVMESDMGHLQPATIHHWVREDFSKFYSHHSWTGSPDDVWVDSSISDGANMKGAACGPEKI